VFKSLKWFLAALAALALLGGVLFYDFDLQAWLRRAGDIHPLVYILVCTFAAPLMAPGSLTKMAAGALYGVGYGVLYGYTGALLGSLLAFAVARTIRQRSLGEKLKESKAVRKYDYVFRIAGWRLVLLMRLSPVIPFNVLNYALGLSEIRLRAVLIGSLGMIPTVATYATAGTMARQLGESAPTPWWQWALFGTGILATLVAGHWTRKLSAEAETAGVAIGS
jgi:uncharacterized membrane protein YdjX (TVP38/TMEM64 family)